MSKCSVVLRGGELKIVRDDFLAGHRRNGMCFDSIYEANEYLRNRMGMRSVKIIDNNGEYVGHTGRNWYE